MQKKYIVLAILIGIGLWSNTLKKSWMNNTTIQEDYRPENDFNTENNEEHSYEYVVSDISWSQAQEDAVEKGGYLVNINSQEEFDRIVSEIRESGYDDIFFRIGGRRTENDSLYYWIDSDNQQIGEPLNTKDSWCQNLWAPEEPSLEYKSIPETCMDMYQSDGKWLWNDVPDHMIEVIAASYSGRLGYIIEYNEPGH